MPLFGHVGEFNKSDKSAWLECCEKLEQYFLANKIEDHAVKRAVFLFTVEMGTYSTLCFLCSPKKPKVLSISESFCCGGTL